MNTRKRNAFETRNKIYNTAKDLFKKYGFENVSVDSIVEAAGVAKGSFYVHFETKDSLVAIYISDYVNKVDTDYKAYIDSFDARTSASDILLSLIEKITDILIHDIGYDQMKTLYRIQITKTANIDAVLNDNREIYKVFHDILSKGVQQGEFKTEIPLDVLAKHCMTAIRGITYEWCIRYPDYDYKEEALQHFRVLLTGIKKCS
ncbi:MAG: TetR/AcrR family transcriptional regulator [Lawsonibacter sp.]